jgi:four helix bundle protein
VANCELGERMENPHVRSYRDLEVWKKAITLAETCYRQTAQFPREEAYGMTAQIRRCAASVAANIAEGHGRENTGSFIQFLRISQGSIKELETHLFCERVGYVQPQPLSRMLDECDTIGRMLRGLIRSLQDRKAKTMNE